MVALEHKPSPNSSARKIGSSTTYVEVDIAANTIAFYVNGVKVEEWS